MFSVFFLHVTNRKIASGLFVRLPYLSKSTLSSWSSRLTNTILSKPCLPQLPSLGNENVVPRPAKGHFKENHCFSGRLTFSPHTLARRILLSSCRVYCLCRVAVCRNLRHDTAAGQPCCARLLGTSNLLLSRRPTGSRYALARRALFSSRPAHWRAGTWLHDQAVCKNIRHNTAAGQPCCTRLLGTSNFRFSCQHTCGLQQLFWRLPRRRLRPRASCCCDPPDGIKLLRVHNRVVQCILPVIRRLRIKNTPDLLSATLTPGLVTLPKTTPPAHFSGTHLVRHCEGLRARTLQNCCIPA